MARLLPVLASVAAACDYILYAMPGDTNIWSKVRELNTVQSPYVLCLAGSTSSRRFNLDNTSAGCVWATSLLVITSLCNADFCDQQTIWLKGSQTCAVTHSLTFVNVTLSGRHYFTDNCGEGEDWCTHCLNPELLLEEQGAYFTVIEHHPVHFDASYQAWQAKCLWELTVYVFEVSKGATLSIEDSIMADVRNKVTSFVWLDSSFLRLIRSQVLRMDPGDAFIEGSDTPDTTVLVQDCWVTGLNRDHVFDLTSDGALCFLYMGSSFTIDNSSFSALIQQTSWNYYDFILSVTLDSFHVTNTTFTRCVGNVLDVESSLTNNTFDSVIFEANYAPNSLLYVADGGTLSMARCQFIDNQFQYYTLVYANLAALTSGVFRNNRALGNNGVDLFSLESRVNLRLENTVFEGNLVMDDTFEAYWSDYYLAHGLLADTGLSSEKALMQNSSSCASVLLVTYSHEVSLANVTITDAGPSCTQVLNLYTIASNSTHLQLSDIQISSQAQIGVIIDCERTSCSLLLQNCRFEWAKELFLAEATAGEGELMASNVTFQYAELGIAAVELSNFESTFLNCRWNHNQGQFAGGLFSSYGSVRLLESHFLNNSCWDGAGDVHLKAGSSGNVFLQVSSCTFTASNSSLNSASLLVTGTLAPSSVSNCTYTQSFSTSGSVLQATHNSGSLLLSSLTFLDINAPSALLILVTVPAPQAVPACTSIEDLQVRRCNFYRGLVTNMGEPQVSTRSSNFTGNNGTLLWIQSGTFSDFGSMYLVNTGPSLCFFGSQTMSSLNHSQFRGNSLSDTTGLLYVEGPQTVVFLQDCEVTDNVADIASAIVQLQVQASVVFNASHFSANRALGSLYYLQDSSLSVQHCTLNDTLDPLQLDNSAAQVLASSFTNTFTRTAGFFLFKSALSLQDVSLSQTQGSGNCLLSALASEAHLIHVSIEDLNCLGETVLLVNSTLSLQSVNMSVVSAKAIFSSAQAQLNMSDVHLTQCSAPVLLAQTSSVSLSQCEFTSIHTQQEALLVCTNCTLLYVLRSAWQHLSAKSVGAILVSALQVTIRYSSFANISANDTGVLQVSASSFQLSDSTFFNATASGSSSRGGALCLSGSKLSIARSSFEHCRAGTGGAVQWLAGSLVEQNNVFSNNAAALYGPNWASFPSSLRTSTLVLYTSLLVYLVDHFGQIVLSDSSSQATLSASQSLGGHLSAVASNGQFLFDEFSVFAKPGSTFTITVSVDALTLDITFVQRTCEVGEIETNRSCERCQAGTFSLVLHATECTPCPEQAECRNGNQLFPKSGYWRPQLDFPGVLPCPWPEACLGHSNFTSQTGVCAWLHGGHLCQTCVEGGCRSGRDRCVPCPDLPLQAGIMSVGLPALWSLQAFASTQTNSRQGTLLRLLVDYLQLTVLVVDYDLFWPQPLQYFYSLHRYLGNALQAFLPLECLDYDAFFVSTAAAALAPPVIAAIFLCCWGLLRLVFKCSSTTLLSVFVNTVIVGVAYVHPFLTRVFLSAFLCESIEEEQWLRADLAVACWDKRHLTYALGVSLPSLLLWGVSLPALVSVYLIRRHCQSADFLSVGWKVRYYLWQVEVCVFKALMAALYVFTAQIEAAAQALTVMAVLAFAFMLQRIYRPYKEAVCNRLALLGVAAVWATAYAGALFSVSGPSIPLIVVVLGLHVWWFLLWTVAVCGARLTPLLWLLCLRKAE